ncbi:MAG TPA: Clp protease N-terminal domain-containing protein [Chloroflexota bacterium]|nr:Clp protease N-terminal domain-containing protein [Chloroflexota bacterium]
MNANFDRFTERARRALTLAQEESQRLNHNYIGPEHLLLGLIREGENVAMTVLAACKVRPEEVRVGLELMVGRSERRSVGEIGLTPRAKKVIELSLDEARRLGHHYLGTEHLLLGLLHEGESIAAGVLEKAGMSLERARAEVVRVLGEMGHDEQPSATEPPGAGSLDDFTERARRVLILAEQEAKRFNHNYVGTEHLLLGLIAEGSGVAAKALNQLGVKLDKVRGAVEFIIGRGEGPVTGEIGLTPRARKVIALARDEGRRLGHHYVGTEHLMLGLIREGEGIAAGILESLGLTLEKVRHEVVRLLAGGAVSEPLRNEPAAASWEYLLLPTETVAGNVHVARSFGEAGWQQLAGLPIASALHALGDAGWELGAVDSTAQAGALYIFQRARR